MGISAHGTQVTIDSTPIGGIFEISGPEEEKALIEVTDHDSGGDREYVPGLRDGGTLTLNCRYEAADDGQQALWASYGDPLNSLSTFVVTPPEDPTVSTDTFTLTFEGFVISRSPAFPFDDAMGMTFGIKISGAVVNSLVSV
jgi:hypothetical protein